MTNTALHVVEVEYCRSCQTHSWCTHHDEAKYHDTFLKLSELIAQRHPQIEVIGNMVPSHLIPFKIAQNKYIDSQTNKYVLYPQIGSFQVTLDGSLIFSKKQQNGWPHLSSILNKISLTLNPNFVCPPSDSPACSPLKRQSNSPRKHQQAVTPSKGKLSEMYQHNGQKKTGLKDSAKGFTLTDHFKLYRPKNKNEEKDWQTEKQESQTSSKRLSEFGRTDSRQKSQVGQSAHQVVLRDLSGETKLRQMLRSRGVLVKDQGRRQMIIKLDSIEEENAYDDNGVTQRTADKHKKTSKIQELEDAFSSLEDKFINFQTKVKDIHTRKQQFELKGSPDESGKRKGELRREEYIKQEKGLPAFERPYIDKPSKLEQYLCASEQEKNEKLHRIYGEWKLLKQTAKKNKRMLKQKRPQLRQDDDSEEETSLSNSQSSANILTFKSKKGSNPMQQHIKSVLQKGHKMSAMEHYQSAGTSSQEQQRFRTQDHFYQGHSRKQVAGRGDVQEESLPVARLFKNTSNTMSLQNMRTALREGNPKILKQQGQVSKFSHNARQSIGKIQARMNKLQQQLHQHKQNQGPSQETYPQRQAQHSQGRSISKSSGSSSSSYQHFIQQKQRVSKVSNPQQKTRKGSQGGKVRGTGQEGQKGERSSYNTRVSDAQKGTSKKINHSRFTNNSQTTHKHQASYIGRPQSFAIEEQSEQKDSNINTKRSQKFKEQNPSHISSRTTQNYNKKTHLPPKNKGEHIRPQKRREEEQQDHPEFHQEERQPLHHKSSRLQKHELHDPLTFLRKQKDWKESELREGNKSQRHSKVIEEETVVNQPRYNKSQSSYSNNKTHVSKFSSRTKQVSKSNSRVSKRQEVVRKVSTVGVQNEKRAYGRIKKNKKKGSQHSSFRQVGAHIIKTEHFNSEGSADDDSRVDTGSKASHQKGNKRILKYYRSQDCCFDGQSSKLVQREEDGCEEDDPSEGHRVEGWAMQSQEEESECQFESDKAQGRNQNKAGEGSESVSRRNSLEKELDHIRRQDGVQATKSEVVQSVPQEHQGKVTSPLQKSTVGDRTDALEQQKVRGERNNSQSRKGRQMSKKEQSGKKRKNGKKDKQKQNIKQVNQAEMEKTEDGEQMDLEGLICKHYSQFLLVKVAYQLAKGTEQIRNEDPPAQANSYENEQITVQVNYCQSIDSIEVQQEPPTTFINFQPSIPYKKSHEAANNEPAEQGSQNSEQDEQSGSEYEQEQEPSQQNENHEKGQCGSLIAGGAVIVEANQQGTPATFKKVESSEAREKSEELAHEQCDNVYSQAQPSHMFKEVGIQKELTLEVSVQTEADPEGKFMASRSSSLHSRSNNQRHQTFKMNETNRSQSNFYKKNVNQQIERASIIPRIYSQDVHEQIQKFTSASLGDHQAVYAEEGRAVRACEAYPEGLLMKDRTLQLQMVATKHSNLLKTVEILCEKSQWLISRLFEDRNGVLRERLFGVWLCKDHRWECVTVDDKLKTDEQDQLLYSRHQGNQMWFNVLEKSLAVTLGGFDNLEKADSSLLFAMLTGCNFISSRIKEDPSKCGKLLHLLTDCLRKNYIIHATKNYDKGRLGGRESVYYINSIRKSGEQTLIEMSQDGCESFWVKLTKFVQEFSKVDILQLRVNHNFAHLDLGVPHPGQMTVVQLDFQQEGQGCVTLGYPGDCGALRVFLYRQEKSKVLKLVGQAKEKNKNNLFFECNFTEGKYYVFAQGDQKPLRLAFIGEAQPTITITEEIHSEGLKNEMAEYLPVEDREEGRLRRTEQEWGIRSSKARLRDNFFESRLRDNFVEYVIGRNKKQ